MRDLNDCSWIFNLKPVLFDSKIDGGKNLRGLIAEDVDKIQTDMIIYVNGEVDGVHYDRLMIPLLVEVQKLRKETDDLRSQLDALKNPKAEVN